MQPAYIQRFVRLAVAIGLLLLATGAMQPHMLGLGGAMQAMAALVVRYILYAAPLALLLGIPAGLRPGSLTDRWLQLPVVLLIGIPAVFLGTVLLAVTGPHAATPAWLTELGAALVVAPWLARALRMGLAASHGAGLRRTALACMGRVLQQYGNIAVCVLPLEALLRSDSPALIGDDSAGTAMLALVLPALLSHLVGDLMVTAAADEQTDVPAGATAASWVGLGALLALGLVVPALAVWGNPQRLSLGAALAGRSGAHLLGTDNLGRDLLSLLGQASRVGLGLSLGATAIATAVGTALGLLGSAFGKWGRLVAPQLESPSLLAPYVAGVCVAVWLKPGFWVTATALGLAMAPWIAPAVHRLATVPAARRQGCRRAYTGRVMTVAARALYVEILLGWMSFSLTDQAGSLGGLFAGAVGAPQLLVTLSIAAAGVAGLNLIGAALGAEE